MFSTTQWTQKHTTSHLENKIREMFQWGSGGWEVEACTSPGVLIKSLWGLYSMSRLCMNFVADLIACRLKFFMSAVACRPVTLRLWGGSLCGCCRWCQLLLTGWCEGFCGLGRKAWDYEHMLFSCLSACWVGEVSTQNIKSIKCISRLFGCMSLGFIARGYGLAASSRATLLSYWQI